MKQELKDKEVILCAAIHYDNGLEYPHQSIYGVKTGFVGRREAAQIALHSGQIKELKFGSELYSEDLY